MLASDLHVHLDGSIRETTLVELACTQGACPQGRASRGYASRLRFGPGMSLRDCLSRFEATVALLQSAGSLARVAAELVEDSYLDGVRHLEVRVCPPLHTRAGLSPDAVLDAVLDGLSDGVATARRSSPDDVVSARVIVTVLEGTDKEEAASLVTLATRRQAVCGVDLAGDESLFDPEPYAAAFARARDAGLGVTIHAGEAGGPDHVRRAVVELGAMRIGHATSAAGDAAVVDLLAERGVVVEVCLSSNLHTGAVARLEEHPLPLLLARDVRVALATDNRFFSSTSLSAEYDLARGRLGIAEEEVARMALESATGAFLPEEERRALTSLYERSLGRPAARAGRSGPGPAAGGGSAWRD